MDSNTFLASLKTRLVEIGLPEEKIRRHLFAFEKLFEGKDSQQIDAIIKSVGGPEGAFNGIYNLEMKKNGGNLGQNVNGPSGENGDGGVKIAKKNEKEPEEKIEVDSKAFEEAAEEEKRQNTEDPVLNSGPEEKPAAEELGSTVVRDKPAEDSIPESEAFLDSPVEVPDIYSRIKDKVRKIKENSDSKGDVKYKIFTVIIDVFALPLILVLFPAVAALALLCFIGFFTVLVAGFAITVASSVNGVLELSSSHAKAFYDIGLGTVAFGSTLFSAALLYNGYKRLSPFLFKHLKKWFKLFFEANKIVFQKAKGE